MPNGLPCAHLAKRQEFPLHLLAAAQFPKHRVRDGRPSVGQGRAGRPRGQDEQGCPAGEGSPSGVMLRVTDAS